MRILYVSPYPPTPDGIGNYTRTIVSAVRAAGHDARVVLPRPDVRATPDVIGSVAPQRQGLNAVRAPLAQWRPDVVHVQFAVAAFGAATRFLPRWLDALRREAGVPVVITMHEVTRDTASLRGPGRLIYRSIAGRGDQIIVHTKAAFNVLTGPVGVPAAKVSVIPHPSAQPPAAAVTATEMRARFGLGPAKLLLAFGFIHVDKGLDDLVAALGLLKRSGQVPLENVRLVVAGTVRRRHGLFRVFEARDRLHLRGVLRMARRNGLLRHLVMTGYVPDGDVAAWFGAADAVVLPYRRSEQSGVAGLAGAFGVIVIASTVGGLGDQIADKRWTFPPRDRHRLADILADFLGSAHEPGVMAADDQPCAASDLASVIARTLDIYSDQRLTALGDLAHVS